MNKEYFNKYRTLVKNSMISCLLLILTNNYSN